MEAVARFRLRMTFEKLGSLAFLSHLEVTSALERVVRRSKLPFAVSQGFSPHMKLSFGSALPVGVGGTGEIADVILKDYVNVNEALKSLQKASSEGLRVIDCKYIDIKASAASIAFENSVYECVYDGEIPDFDVPETIEVVRKKKLKVLNVDDYLVEMPTIEGQNLTCTLRSSQAGALRIDKLLESFQIDTPLVSITRTKQF